MKTNWDMSDVQQVIRRNKAMQTKNNLQVFDHIEQKSGMVKKVKTGSVKSKGEETLEFQLKAMNITGWVREYKFCETRRFRFDFCFPALMIAAEVEGRGHQKDNRYHGDLEKYNLAAQLGWKVYRYTSAEVLNGTAIQKIERILCDVCKNN